MITVNYPHYEMFKLETALYSEYQIRICSRCFQENVMVKMCQIVTAIFIWGVRTAVNITFSQVAFGLHTCSH